MKQSKCNRIPKRKQGPDAYVILRRTSSARLRRVLHDRQASKVMKRAVYVVLLERKHR